MTTQKQRKPDGYWTLARCRKAWTYCKTITEFARTHSGAYDWLHKNGLLGEIHKDLKRVHKQPYWTLERCRDAWKSCSSITEFVTKYKSAYCAVSRKGWIEIMRKDFPDARVPNGYWSLSRCRKAWKTCATITDFARTHSAAYSATQENGWLNEMRKDFPDAQNPHGYWTLERCIKAWRSCTSIKEFATKYAAAYSAVKKNGWLKEMRKSLESSRVPNGYWTLKRCQEVWRACFSISEFIKKYPAVYTAVHNNGWAKHMRRDFPDARRHAYWTHAKCREAWRTCSTITEFVEKFSAAYTLCKRNGWLDEMRAELPPDYRYTSNDVVYIWRAGIKYRRKYVYKVGITSKRRGIKRIEKVSKAHNTTHTLLRYSECSDAIAIESAILEVATPITGIDGDGASEMFTSSSKELNKILDLFDRLIIEQLNGC